MRGADYAELAAFAAVVDHGSFTRAAAQLRMAPSSLSQVIKRLEARLGVELLQRTTRHVSVTGAGARLFGRFRPAMIEMEAAIVDLHEQSRSPVGLVRVHLPRAAYAALLETRLDRFHRTYPGIQLELVVDDALIDIVGAGVDVDIRSAGAVTESVVATTLGGPTRHVVVASPAYLAAHGTPRTPMDLVDYRCIQWRRPGTEHAYPWTFQIDGCSTPIEVRGPLTVSHCDIAVSAAAQSLGLAFVLEQHAASAMASGNVVAILQCFLPPLPGWIACHPRAARISAATRAVITFLSTVGSPASERSIDPA